MGTAQQQCSNDEIIISDEKVESEFKELVVIGNGPSGIALSYLLSGHWPYYAGVASNEFLHTRLMLEPDLSLVEQDLEFLSDGLEGRSDNPVSLLLDALQKPNADLGVEDPSLLEWRHDSTHIVDHVVLGRGKPGGVWQTLSGDMLTVSLGGWMELPNLSMEEWRNSMELRMNKLPSLCRTSVETIAQYYSSYVEIMGMAKHFRNYTVVTAVKEISPDNIPNSTIDTLYANKIMSGDENHIECEEMCTLDDDVHNNLSSLCSSLTQMRILSRHFRHSYDQIASLGCQSAVESPTLTSSTRFRKHCNYERSVSSPEVFDSDTLPSWDLSTNSLLSSSSCNSSLDNDISTPPGTNHRSLFEVTGYEMLADEGGKSYMKQFQYLTKNVVLATGQSDLPNKLRVPGEDLPFVLHNIGLVAGLVDAGLLTSQSAPVMVVGAGLSAADAIISLQSYGVRIAHVFRKSARDPSLIFNKLPPGMYPEYREVHKMMMGTQERGYQVFSETSIKEIFQNRRVILNNNICLQVSFILVLIGFSPDLSFLSSPVGQVPGTSRQNNLDINHFTHEVTGVSGLYAMGPLTGDNFVRFIQGGALAITAHMAQKKKEF